MKQLYIYLLILANLTAPLAAQKNEQLTIRMDTATVVRDSLCLDGTFHIPELQLPSTGKLIFQLRLEQDTEQLELPPVIIIGKRRLRYEQREQTVSPQNTISAPAIVQIAKRKKESRTMEIAYHAAVPYASWMQHARLRLEQWLADCCHEQLLASDLLSEDIGVDYSCGETVVIREPGDTVYIALPAVEVPLCHKCTVIYVDFPQGSYHVDRTFEGNRRELLKVDSIMQQLPADPFIMQINSYASPEGSTPGNDLLAENRLKGFTRYLREQWRLPEEGKIETVVNGEDWEGLLTLLRLTDKSYADEVTAIIRSEPNRLNRKKELKELRHGAVWADMMADLFPLLRRIEIRIVTE